MAEDKRISDLTPLTTPAESGDLFAIVDVSESDISKRTKKITKAVLMASPGPIGSVTPNFGIFTSINLALGSTINEFSIDGTLAGDSNVAVPTEKAVKTYVDTSIAGLAPNKIWQGDSSVEVIDTFATSEIKITIDGTVEGIWSDTGLALKSGVPVNEISNDPSLADDSTASLVTEHAIKVAIANATLAGTSGTSGTSGAAGTSGSSGTSGAAGTSGSSGTSGTSAGGSILPGIDNHVARYDSTAIIQSSLVEIDDYGNVTGINNLVINGDLFVDGTTFVVYQEEVRTSDNIIVINYGEPGPGVTSGFAGIDIDRGLLTDYRFAFYEDTDTFRIGEIGDLQAVATREDNPLDLRVAWWNDFEKRFDTQGDSYIQIDTTGSEIKVVINNSDQLIATGSGIKLSTGATINEFSTDGTLSGDSDTAVPTEKAVKTYIDNLQILNLRTKFVSSDSTCVSGDAVLVDTTGGDVNIILVPSLDGQIVVKKITPDSNQVIITVLGGGTIDRDNQRIIYTGDEAYYFLSDSIDFYII